MWKQGILEKYFPSNTSKGSPISSSSWRNYRRLCTLRCEICGKTDSWRTLICELIPGHINRSQSSLLCCRLVAIMQSAACLNPFQMIPRRRFRRKFLMICFGRVMEHSNILKISFVLGWDEKPVSACSPRHICLNIFLFLKIHLTKYIFSWYVLMPATSVEWKLIEDKIARHFM